MVGADGVGELPEVHLEEGGHGVDVGQHAAVVVQIWHAILIEGNSAEIKTN